LTNTIDKTGEPLDHSIIRLVIVISSILRGGKLKYEPWDEMESTLALVDAVKSDAMEAGFLTGQTDIDKAAHPIQR